MLQSRLLCVLVLTSYFKFLLTHLIVSGETIWQTVSGPDAKRSGDWERGEEESLMLESGHIVREKRNAKRNADWKGGENQSSERCLIDSLPRCFLQRCQEQRDCSPLSSPLLFAFPSSSLFFIHHLPPHPSSHCRLLPKRLAKLRQHLSHFSLHCSPYPPPRTLPLPPLADFLAASHPRCRRSEPQNDTPLILLLCNLQRR